MEETSFDLKKTALILYRRTWILLLGLLLGAGLGWLVSTRIPPVYQAMTKVFITRTGQSQSVDVTAYLSDTQLTQNYLQLLNTRTIQDLVSTRLGVQIEPEDIQPQVIQDSQIIEIYVENVNSQQAALIANALVDVLIEQSKSSQSVRFDSMEESLKAQKAQIETKIKNLQGQIEKVSVQDLDKQKTWIESNLSSLDAERDYLQQEILDLGTINSPEKKVFFDQKNARLGQINSLLSLYQENYNNLLLSAGAPIQNSSETTNSQLALLINTRTLYEQSYITVVKNLETAQAARQQIIPSIVQIEVATPPEEPIRPSILINTILSGLAGFMLVLGIVFVREMLDDTLKTPEDVEQAFGVPVIGFIPEIQYKDKSARTIHVSEQPYSQISDAFRSIRTKLEYASAKEPIHTLLITSLEYAEGKSTIAANLAAILSLSKKRIALVDANMRHPQIHSFLGIPNGEGFSSLLLNKTPVDSVFFSQPDLPCLSIVTSGDLPPQSAELLSSKAMSQILAELDQQVDMVIIDAPPCSVIDTQILAGKVDAVLLVVWSSKTTATSVKKSLNMSELVNARVIGTIMNRIPHS
jgi:capsular exopolysaccharide synthesis family protein